MAADKLEGQMDFLGLISEYTDAQGATVRVKSPAARKPRKERASEPQQIKLDFLDLDAEYEQEMAAKADSDKVAEAEATDVEDVAEAEVLKVETPNVEAPKPETSKPKLVKARLPKVTTDDQTDAEPVVAETAVTEPGVTEPNEQVEAPQAPSSVDEILRPQPAQSLELPQEPAPKARRKASDKSSELLFKQCKRCWCYDCKHNSRNEAVPREMCGAMIACPACNSCIIEEMATVCEIGNAEEGCKFRAIEEGIFVVEEPED